MNIKNIVFVIAIIILTISVAVYGIIFIYNPPEYINYCGGYKTVQFIENSQQCEEIGGYWNYDELTVVEGKEQRYCDRNYYCGLEYNKEMEKYSKKVFIIAVPLGIIVIILGAIVFGLEVVGAGLMGGGVGIIIFGVGGFWKFAENWFKFAMSLIGLVVLIWFVYKFNNNGFNFQKNRRKRKWKKGRMGNKR